MWKCKGKNIRESRVSKTCYSQLGSNPKLSGIQRNKETQPIERQKHRGEEGDRDRLRGKGMGVRVGAGPGRQGQVWDPAFGIVKLSQVSLQP